MKPKNFGLREASNKQHQHGKVDAAKTYREVADQGNMYTSANDNGDDREFQQAAPAISSFEGRAKEDPAHNIEQKNAGAGCG